MLDRLISELLAHFNKERTRRKIVSVLKPWFYKYVLFYYLTIFVMLAIIILLLVLVIYLLCKQRNPIPG